MFTTRPEILGTFGVVTSTHWLASAVGMAMMERGGNAFDAAVAAGFTLQVVEPHLNGPGVEKPSDKAAKDENFPRSCAGKGGLRQKRQSHSLVSWGSFSYLVPDCCRRSCRVPLARGCGCWPISERCGCGMCWRRRSAMPGTGIRFCRRPLM